jgi:uncharacterized membrane protein YkgB
LVAFLIEFIRRNPKRQPVPPSGFGPVPAATFNAKALKMLQNFAIAERTTGSRISLILLRIALIVIFVWFGCMKFTAYEANGNAGLIANSPFMSWMNVAFGIQGASYVIGTIELSTAAALLLGAFVPLFSVLGAAMSTATFTITLTFFLSTPGVAEPTAGGFPAISAPIGQFLLKDLVLFAASLNLLLGSVENFAFARKAAFANR